MTFFVLSRYFLTWIDTASVADPDMDPPDQHVFGLSDPDPLVRGMDLGPDPSIIMQK
jgi:hypothetical protein